MKRVCERRPPSRPPPASQGEELRRDCRSLSLRSGERAGERGRVLLALLCLTLCACPEDAVDPPPKVAPRVVAMLVELGGKLTLTRDGATQSAAAGPLYQGDVLATGADGHALLRGDGREVELLENSRFTVGRSLSELKLDLGELVFLDSDAGTYSTAAGEVRPGEGSRVKLLAGDGGTSFVVGMGELTFLDDDNTQLKQGQRFVVGMGVLELEDIAKPPPLPEKKALKVTPKGVVTLKPKTGPVQKLPPEGRELTESATFTVEKNAAMNVTASGARAQFAAASKGSVEPLGEDAQLQALLQAGSTRIVIDAGQRVVIAGKKPLELAAKEETTVVVTATKTGPRVDVVRGELAVTPEGGPAREVGAGESALLKGNNLTELEKAAPVLTLSASRNAKVAWNRAGEVALAFDDKDTLAEVAADAAFENVLLARKPKQPLVVTAPLRGVLYWRQGGEAGQARFEKDEGAGGGQAKTDTVAETGLKATVYFQSHVPTLTFTFPPKEGAVSWRFRVYAAGDLKTPLVDKRVTEAKAVVESGTLPEGSYLWSAVPALASGAEAAGGRMNKMELVFDNQVTRLVVHSPKDGQKGGKASGLAPPGAKLFLNGKPVPLDGGGRFQVALPSAPAAVFRVAGKDDSYVVRRLGR